MGLYGVVCLMRLYQYILRVLIYILFTIQITRQLPVQDSIQVSTVLTIENDFTNRGEQVGLMYKSADNNSNWVKFVLEFLKGQLMIVFASTINSESNVLAKIPCNSNGV